MMMMIIVIARRLLYDTGRQTTVHKVVWNLPKMSPKLAISNTYVYESRTLLFDPNAILAIDFRSSVLFLWTRESFISEEKSRRAEQEERSGKKQLWIRNLRRLRFELMWTMRVLVAARRRQLANHLHAHLRRLKNWGFRCQVEFIRNFASNYFSPLWYSLSLDTCSLPAMGSN